MSVDWNSRGLGGGRHRGHPRRDVVDRRRARPAVAGRGRDEHAGRVGVEEGQLDRVGERVGATRDGEVDDVDAVQDGLGHRGGGVGAEATVGTADLVDRDPGAGRDAVDRAPLDTEHLGRADRRRRRWWSRCGCRGRRCPAPIRVDLATDHRVVGVDERLASDQLVVALEDVDLRGQRVVTEVAGPGRTGRGRKVALVGEGRVLRPGAAVEYAEDHALAGACSGRRSRR